MQKVQEQRADAGLTAFGGSMITVKRVVIVDDSRQAGIGVAFH